MDPNMQAIIQALMGGQKDPLDNGQNASMGQQAGADLPGSLATPENSMVNALRHRDIPQDILGQLFGPGVGAGQ
jgi:hypothetical protein